MDRRNFLKGVVGGGALGLAPVAALADASALPAEARRGVMLLAQGDLPQAMAIARGIAAGVGASPVAVDARQLGTYAGITEILDRAAGARVIGVMDDASALIFQQIAAARGAGLVMDTHRRVGTASLVSFAINT